jgi:4'-phosphopantetheinyl transferase
MAVSAIHIWITQQHESLNKGRFDELAAGMPEIVRKELFAYKRWEDAQASLFGKLLLKQALQELGIPFSIQDLSVLNKDRPFIDVSFDFNISHSGDYIVLALSKANKVGIDIEKHRQLDIQLFRKYFSEEEWDQIMDAETSSAAFFTFWAIKESAIKCDGRGVEVLGKTKTLNNNSIECDGQLLFYSMINIHEDYSCAICSVNVIEEIILKEVRVL